MLCSLMTATGPVSKPYAAFFQIFQAILPKGAVYLSEDINKTNLKLCF